MWRRNQLFLSLPCCPGPACPSLNAGPLDAGPILPSHLILPLLPLEPIALFFFLLATLGRTRSWLSPSAALDLALWPSVQHSHWLFQELTLLKLPTTDSTSLPLTPNPAAMPLAVLELLQLLSPPPLLLRLLCYWLRCCGCCFDFAVFVGRTAQTAYAACFLNLVI